MLTLIKRAVLPAFLALCSSVVTTLPAIAQDWPSRPLHIVVPTVAGQGSDVMARLFAEHLGMELKQAVVVDNKPGATGVIAMDFVRNAPADGYTLLLSSTGPLSINPNVIAKLPYALSDYIPVAHLSSQPLFLIASAKSGIKDFAGLVGQAKSKPGVLNYGSSGAGSTQRVAMEMLMSDKELDLTHILYKSSPQMITELMAGTIDAAFEVSILALPLRKSDRVQFLAVSTPQRSSLAPDVPSLQELGVPGFDASIWSVILVKSGTPPAIVARLQAALQKVSAKEAVLSGLRLNASEPGKVPPNQLNQFLQEQLESWGKALRRVNIFPS
jgi:tripartite-type tricarboxylate transporter receptor subunit TctC